LCFYCPDMSRFSSGPCVGFPMEFCSNQVSRNRVKIFSDITQNKVIILLNSDYLHIKKGPKHEIFVSGVFTQNVSVWVGDFGNRQKNLWFRLNFFYFLVLSLKLLKKFKCCRRQCLQMLNTVTENTKNI
jgi:hypothetical protein